MPAPGPGKRLTIYLGESDSWRGRSLYLSILETLRKSGIAGATVMRGLAGFGAHSIIRVSSIEPLSMDLPIVIVVVDSAELINRALALIGPMVREGLITLEDVNIVKYTHRYLHPLPADRPVAEIMTGEVSTVMPDTPVLKVVELLLGKLFKAVPVVDEDGQVVGIISDGDLLRKAGMPARLSIGERLSADELRTFLAQISHEKTAGQIMTAPVHTVRTDAALGHVVQYMLQVGLKRLPVVDSQDKLVGMVSRLDVLRAISGDDIKQQERAPSPRPGRTIGDLIAPEMPTVHVNDDLVDVLQQMLKADIRRVIVLDEQDKAVGIITEGDIVARVSPVIRRNVIQMLAAKVSGADLSRGSATARDIMSEHVLSAPQETTVIEAITLMLQQGRKQLVVVDQQGRPVGIVVRQTLLAASLGI
jgi:CBS domain-containing protein